ADIDRRLCHRIDPMRILCLVMPRTWTLSTQKALTIHGYPISHFSSIFGNTQGAGM
ncbi:hypothetical protein DOTSEDRAFT_116839, partial [Dothistroma septosporum NZE10]